MQIQIAAKRQGSEWRGALIVNGEFQNALVEKNLSELVGGVLPTLLATFQNEASILLTVNMVSAPKENIGG